MRIFKKDEVPAGARGRAYARLDAAQVREARYLGADRVLTILQQAGIRR